MKEPAVRARVPLLLAAAAIAVAACGGPTSDRGPVRSLGAQAGGTCNGVTESSFFSASRGMDIDFTIWQPPGVVAGETYPAVYFLHGSGGDEQSFFQLLNAIPAANGDCGSYLTGLMQGGTLPKMYLVGVSDEGGGWSDENEAMVVEELPAHVEANWNVTSAREGRHIQGFSMGAAGAMRYPAENSDRYCSTVIMAEKDTEKLDDFWIDNQASILANDLWARLVVGSEDTGRVQPMQDFFATLQGLGVSSELEIVQGVGHSGTGIMQAYPNPLVDLEFQAACSGGEPFPSNPGGAGAFDDDDGSIFEADIEWLAAQGITEGCGVRLFCPNDPVTRGQMAAFLHRALPTLPEIRAAIDFSDDDTSIFEGDIEWLYSRGITDGTGATTYSPGADVTRGQMAAFLVRSFGYADDGGGNLFIDDNTSIFELDIDKLATAGVTLGCNPPANTMFCPGDSVTRGQMAAFLHRAMT